MQSIAIPHCWQYLVRKESLAKDLRETEMTPEEMARLKVRDFKLDYIPRENKKMCHKIKGFIERHEWLGKMPHRPTHRFIATYRGHIAGAIVMATPNSFCNFFGKENRHKEKLISRGACISWSPKNLASSLIMYSIRWMAQNTHYRFFTGYSDTTAGELGTIYQACNFTYLGQNWGTRFHYFDPQGAQRGWFSDRIFRKFTSFKKYALQLGIIWQKSWGSRDKVYWSEVPFSISAQLKNAAKEHQKRCLRRSVPRKYKYLYILGQDKRETKRLRQYFKQLNPSKANLSYPKERGPSHPRHLDTHIHLGENLVKA